MPLLNNYTILPSKHHETKSNDYTIKSQFENYTRQYLHHTLPGHFELKFTLKNEKLLYALLQYLDTGTYGQEIIQYAKKYNMNLDDEMEIRFMLDYLNNN